MKIIDTVKEIGLFEEALNLYGVIGSTSVVEKAGAEMPLPTTDIRGVIPRIARWLLDFSKTRYLFLTPEIALIEEMAKQTNRPFEAIIIAPADLDIESRARLNNNLNNLPRCNSYQETVLVTIIEEHSYGMVFPSDTMIVVCGYDCGERMMVMEDTYRLLLENDKFYGKRAFIPYTSLNRYCRYTGWLEARASKLNERWRA